MRMNITMIDGVEWAECPSWKGYAADRDGRIINPRGVILKQHKGHVNHKATFYMKVSACREGEKKCHGVHQLVADAWLGPCPDGMEVDHKDFDKANNRPSNLEYVTHQENVQRARDAGRFPDMAGFKSPNFGKPMSDATRGKMSLAKLGSSHWRAKSPDVGRILELRATGLTDAAIAKQMGLGRTTVGGVLRGTHWSVRKEYVDKAYPEGRAPCVPQAATLPQTRSLGT